VTGRFSLATGRSSLAPQGLVNVEARFSLATGRLSFASQGLINVKGRLVSDGGAFSPRGGPSHLREKGGTEKIDMPMSIFGSPHPENRGSHSFVH
jgi:hypothetical protein